MISPPCVAIRSETLAVSMLDPPPTATNPSNSPSTAKSAAAWNESSVGSTRERSHTSTSMPSASISSTIRPAISAFTTPGSETSITRPTPIRFSSQPASSEAPGPYFSGVASIVKTVSLLDLGPLPISISLSPRQLVVPCYPLQWANTSSAFGSIRRAILKPAAWSLKKRSSLFAVDHVANKPATRYAERQTPLVASATKVLITRPAVGWLHTLEAEKPVQICVRPGQVEPLVQPATPLGRWSVSMCEVSKPQRAKGRVYNNSYI